MAKYYVCVGTYGSKEDDAIQLLEFDSLNETLSKIGSISGISNPSYLTVNKQLNRLYAISEVEKGEVVSYEVDFVKGTLLELNRQRTGSPSPCFVSFDENENWLFTANYGGGSVSVFPINADSTIAPCMELKEYSNANSKKVSHPHQIKQIPFSNKFIVTDLGHDKLHVYQFDYDYPKLEWKGEIPAVDDSGPRHFAVHPQYKKIYVVGEFNSSISVYSYEKSVKVLELVQQVKTIPGDFTGENYCADIHISPSGTHLYASNRGHHSVATYNIMKNGLLQHLYCSKVKGSWPRNFAVVPNGSYLLVANEHSNSIVAMKLDENGEPRTTNLEYKIKKPVCLQVIENGEPTS